MPHSSSSVSLRLAGRGQGDRESRAPSEAPGAPAPAAIQAPDPSPGVSPRLSRQHVRKLGYRLGKTETTGDRRLRTAPLNLQGTPKLFLTQRRPGWGAVRSGRARVPAAREAPSPRGLLAFWLKLQLNTLRPQLEGQSGASGVAAHGGWRRGGSRMATWGHTRGPSIRSPPRPL